MNRALETTTWLTGRVLLILFTATVFGRILVEKSNTCYCCAVNVELDG